MTVRSETPTKFARRVFARRSLLPLALPFIGLHALLPNAPSRVTSQPPPPPSVVDPALAVRIVVTGLNQPTTKAFIGQNDFLVLEKPTGKVLRVTNGVLPRPVLDLAVSSAVERRLLGFGRDYRT